MVIVTHSTGVNGKMGNSHATNGNDLVIYQEGDGKLGRGCCSKAYYPFTNAHYQDVRLLGHGLTTQQTQMTFDGLNEYLRKNKKNPLLFIFPPLIMLLIFLFDERYFGENEGYPTWRVALWGIFFLLCVATVCYVLK